MKKTFILSLLAGVMLLLASCKEELPPQAHTLTLSEKSIVIIVDSVVTIDAILTPAVEGVSIDWSSSDKSVARVKRGKVTGVSAGEAIITASCQIGEETLSCKCKVKVYTSRFMLDPSEARMRVDSVISIKAYKYNERVDNLTWESSNTAVATVSNDGLVTAVGTGVCRITAHDDEDIAECMITVYQKGVNIELPNRPFVAGDTAHLSYSVVEVEESALVWSTSDIGVATISQEGVLTIFSEGTVTITLTMGSYSCSSVIMVDAFSISEHAPRVAVDASVTLLTNAQGNVTWQSSNESVLTIDANGVATGVADGWTIITAYHGAAFALSSIMVGAYTAPSFSVSATEKVYFAPGNLQYRPSTATWRFAPNQWDVCGANNDSIHRVSTYTGWLDLFCWGSGATSPLAWRGTWNNYVPFEDWGAATIYEGTKLWPANTWSTLSYDQFYYLLNTRTKADRLYGTGAVGGQNGLIILPDDFVQPAATGIFNYKRNSYYNNIYDAAQWALMEASGAIFLPSAGYLDKTTIFKLGEEGDYWTSSSSANVLNKYTLFFNIAYQEFNPYSAYNNFSVRLARPAED